MKCLKYLFCSGLLLCMLVMRLHGQEHAATFGFQLEPLIPSGLIRSNFVRVVVQDVEFVSNPRPGFGYGAHVSFRFKPRMAIETGINYLRRDTRITATETNGFTLDLEYTVDNFEIPLTFHYSLRLGERWYMDQGIGLSFQFLPSELKSRVFERDAQGASIYDFSQMSVRNYWVMPVFRGGIGLEYRTENIGSFYIGPVYRLFSTLYFTQIQYKHQDINITNLVIKPVGDYFSVVVRYVFK